MYAQQIAIAKQLGADNQRVQETIIALEENIKEERSFGATEQTRATRARLIHIINTELKISFIHLT